MSQSADSQHIIKLQRQVKDLEQRIVDLEKFSHEPVDIEKVVHNYMWSFGVLAEPFEPIQD